MSSPRHLEQSRTVPFPVETAFDAALTAPLPQVVSQWFGPLPPVREIREQTGEWGTVGQERVIVTADRGTMRERLTAVDRPDRFTYVLSDIAGPMKPLARSIDGQWAFKPVGTGTRITWSWVVHPASAVGGLALPVIARLWRPYAARVLAKVEQLLIES